LTTALRPGGDLELRGDYGAAFTRYEQRLMP
jgi:hypothetical protein